MTWLKLDCFFALDKASFSALLSMGVLVPVGQPMLLQSLESETTLRAATCFQKSYYVGKFTFWCLTLFWPWYTFAIIGNLNAVCSQFC